MKQGKLKESRSTGRRKEGSGEGKKAGNLSTRDSDNCFIGGREKEKVKRRQERGKLHAASAAAEGE